MFEVLCCSRRCKRNETWLMISAIFVTLVPVLGHTILEEYNCGQEDIEYNVTLRGGQFAGIFKDRGPVKNMQECMHMCCNTKNCDVAMMHGPKCFSVHCLNDSVCETIPADDEDIDMQIAHMTTKGTGQLTKALVNDNLDSYDPEAKCPHNEIMYNVKLMGGLKAGKFTDIGKVKSIKTCIRYCCEAKVQPCDLAFMLSDRCYLVKCYSEDRCQAIPAAAIDHTFKQKMAFVAPWLYEKNKKVVKIPSGQSPHHLQCIQSKRYTKSQLLDGRDAGLFTDVGRVANPQICTRLCCEDPSCDLAYMFGRTCFLVKCYSEHSCRTVPDEDAWRNNTNFDRSTQYIVKRKFGVRLSDDGTPVMRTETNKEEICRLDGEIRNKTILQAGMVSGKLTHHKGVKDMTSCIKRCCAQEQCHVAMMMADKCYSVFCTNEQFCQPKPAPVETHHTNPTVAYVKRGEISFAPKRKSVMPFIERFHPNVVQAVQEEYVEADDNEDNGSGKEDEGQRNSLQSNVTKDDSAVVAGNGGNGEDESDQSGSGDSGDDGSGESGSGDSSNDALEQEEQSSGESGAEDSGESGDENDSGESGDAESGDGDEADRSDGQQGLSQLRNPLSIQGVLYE
ncbi:uncharacterized protein LOC144664683 isoform X2 [Oculina patagonica]